MTLAIVIAAPDSIWACVDRQLGTDPRPTGVKVAIITAADGTALLAYAGVGRIGRTEVSRWVNQTLTGINWPLEQMLRQIARASLKRLLPEAARNDWNHSFIASAFHNGAHRLYVINKDARLTPQYLPRRGIAWEVAGAGERVIAKHFKSRGTAISQLIALNTRGIVSAKFVAEQLAKLNIAVSAKAHALDGISPECIVVHYTPQGANPRFDTWVFNDKGYAQNRGWGIVPHVFHGNSAMEQGKALWGPLIARQLSASPDEDPLKLFKESIAELRADMPARLATVPNTPDDRFK
jgi:hypothetical protein